MQSWESLGKRESIEPKVSGELEPAVAGNFKNFPISEASQLNLTRKGISYLFPIQQKTFLPIHEGKDLIGKDRTGSGKTLAFALPLLERIRKQGNLFQNKHGQHCLLMVLVPTRELATQVTREFERFKNSEREYRVLTVYGGVPIYSQISALHRGVEVVVGTPGRMIDLLQRKALNTKELQALVLDETDEMLNIGFQEDIEMIMKLICSNFEDHGKSADKLQYLLFSATIPPWINRISSKFMKPNLVLVDMIRNSDIQTSKTVEHFSLRCSSQYQKMDLIGDLIKTYGNQDSRIIVFTETKQEANQLRSNGLLRVYCQVLHGDIPQRQREMTFAAFRAGTLKCIVATNVAARGLDIPSVDLIIQLSPPKDIESYIHRSGRTGRAGSSGRCITMFTGQQYTTIYKIEQQTKITFKTIKLPLISSEVRSEATRPIQATHEPQSSVNPNEWNQSRSSNFGFGVKSLLFGVEGYVSFVIESETSNSSTSYFISLLKNCFSPTVLEAIRGIRLLSSHRGIIFDLQLQKKPEFEAEASKLAQSSAWSYAARHIPDFEDPHHPTDTDINLVSQSKNQESGETETSIVPTPGPTKDASSLFVSNLSYDTVTHSLKSFVEGLDMHPIDVFVPRNGDKGKGFGYVRFSDPTSAKNAYANLSNKMIGNRRIRIEFAEKKKA